MAHELGTDKRISTVSVDLELHYMILRRYWIEPDGYDANGDKRYAPAYRRALNDAVLGVQLTADDYQLIADKVRAAENARMEKRNSRK